MPNASTDWKSICSVERFARNWAPGHPSRNPIPHTETCSFFLFASCVMQKGRMTFYLFLSLFILFFSLASKLICMSGIEFTRRFDSKCSPRPSWHFFLLLSPRHPGQNARLKSDTLHNHGASITSREPLKTTRTQFQPHHRSSFIWDRIDTGEMILQLR